MNGHRKKKKKKKKASSSNPEVQYNQPNDLDKIFQPIILTRFCTSFAEYLDHGLTREQLLCLHKECTEIAFYIYDVHLRIQLIRLSFSKNIPFDRRLKEFFVSLSLNGSGFEDRILRYKECLEFAKATRDKYKEMNTYWNLGALNEELHQYYDAIAYNKKCLAIAREIGDKNVAMLSCISMGRTYREIKLDSEAIAYCKSCISIAREIDRQDIEMTACFIVGKLYFSQSNYKEALHFSKRSLENAKAVGNKRYESMSYLLIQDCQYNMSDYKDAVLTGQKTIAAASEIGDKLGEKVAYAILGKTYKSLNKYEEAVHCITISLKLEVDHKQEMQGHYFLGEIHRSCKNYYDAIESFKKAIVIAWKIGDKNMQMQVYCEIGNIYEFMNQYDKAICYGKKYMEVAKEIGTDTDVMEAYLALGVAYLGSDNYGDTFFNLNKGLKIATELKNTSVAATFNSFLNELHLRVKALGNATNFAGFISCGRPCLKLLKESSDQEDRKCNEFFQQYECYMLNEDYEQAILCLKRQLELFERCAHYHGTDKVYCLLEIAEIHYTLGQYEKSLHCCRKSLAIASHVDAKHLQAISYCRQGLTYVKLKQMNEAENSFREAIRNFESMFKALGGEDFKISLLDAYVNCYKYLVNVLVHTRQVEEALVVSDRGRACSLNDILQKYGMNGEINEIDFECKDIESHLSKNKCSTFFYTICGPMAYVFIIDNESNLQFSVKHFGCSCTHKITFETFVDEALKEIEVLDHVAGNCENRSLDKPESQYSHGHLSEETRSPPADEKPEKCEESIKGSTLEWLHKMLITHEAIFSFDDDGTPIVTKNVKYFGQQDEILIIPDGPLYKVPFAALRDPETGQYLSETKRIRLVPSLATLKMLQGRTEDCYSMKDALIVGNPYVGKVMFDGEETEFDPLENAFAEVLLVGRVFDETPLTGEKATKSAVIEKLKQGVAVVHIAAHGSLNKGTIALAPSPEIRATKIPDEEDYMLTMTDVQQAQVRAQLVVLSCCHSGRGEIRAEGVVGMCRAFLASGARAVVASLWTIDDEATADFMFKFYIGLMDGMSASVSLQRAMKEMRNIASYSEPKYWAPFFLMGDDVTIKC